MGLLAVDLALLRDVLLPGLTLSPGRVVAARVVAADQGSGGRLAIAGWVLDAELPRELTDGDSVRLEVRDVNAERVLLAVAGHETAAAHPPPPDGVGLPDGAWLTITDDDAAGQGSGGRRPGAQTLSLQLQMPALGTVDLRFELDPGALRAALALAPGDPLACAQAHAPALRDALADVTERPATVTVTARREPVDLYA